MRDWRAYNSLMFLFCVSFGMYSRNLKEKVGENIIYMLIK